MRAPISLLTQDIIDTSDTARATYELICTSELKFWYSRGQVTCEREGARLLHLEATLNRRHGVALRIYRRADKLRCDREVKDLVDKHYATEQSLTAPALSSLLRDLRRAQALRNKRDRASIRGALT